MKRITRKKYHVIATSACPWCDRARELLESKGLDFYVDDMGEQPELLNEMKSKMNYKTVPMIWEISEVGSKKFIGGYSDLVQHFMKQQAPKGKNLLNG